MKQFHWILIGFFLSLFVAAFSWAQPTFAEINQADASWQAEADNRASYIERFLGAREVSAETILAPQAATPCVNGMAGIFPCEDVDLQAHMPLSDIGGGQGTDIWGWTDPTTSKEYAIIGRTSGTSFIDISDPVNPIYLGNLPTHTVISDWRDVKVYKNHAYIVSEAGGHGLQIFDLTQLASVAAPPATFTNSAHYGAFGNAHNIVINEDTGFAYAVGT